MENVKLKDVTFKQWVIFVLFLLSLPLLSGFILSSFVALFKLGWVW